MNDYNKALTWLIRSKYDVKSTLTGKTDVKIELYENNQVIKSETVPFTTETVKHIQNKILTLYNHFNN